MSALASLPTAGTVASFDVELGDDGDNGRQIGLILDNDPWIDEVGLTVRAMAARDVDDAIDAFGGRRGAIRRRVAFATARFLPAQLGVSAAKGSGLPMRFPPG